MFGREARLSVDVISGLPYTHQSIDSHEFLRKAQNMPFAYTIEIPRQNLCKRAASEHRVSQTRNSYSGCKPVRQVQHHTSLLAPWIDRITSIALSLARALRRTLVDFARRLSDLKTPMILARANLCKTCPTGVWRPRFLY